MLAFLLRCEAYLLCTVDILASAGDVQIELAVRGRPTVRSALLRLIAAIPAAVVVLLASAMASVLGVIASVSILLVRQVPGWLLNFQRATSA